MSLMYCPDCDTQFREKEGCECENSEDDNQGRIEPPQDHFVHVHENSFPDDSVVVEIRPEEYDNPSDRDMERLSRENAEELRDQLDEVLNSSNSDYDFQCGPGQEAIDEVVENRERQRMRREDAEKPAPLVKKIYKILTDPWSDAKLDAIAEIEKHYDKEELREEVEQE